MDFLLFRGFSSADDTFKKRLSRITLVKYHPVEKHKLGDLTLLTTGMPLASEDALLVFDGTILTEKSVISNFCKPDFVDVEACFNLVRNQYDVDSGTFCISKIEKNKNRFELHVDPLSAYIEFYYRDDYRYAVSNNVYFIEKLLSREGISTERKFESYIGEITFNSNAGFSSGISKTNILDSLHQLSGSTDLAFMNKRCLASIF